MRQLAKSLDMRCLVLLITGCTADVVSQPGIPVTTTDLASAEIEATQPKGTWEVRKFSWGIGWASASAELTPWDDSLVLAANGDNGRQETKIRISEVVGEKVIPLSICLVRNNVLIVAAKIKGQDAAQLIRIEFDNHSVDLPFSAEVIYSGSDFSWPSSIFFNEDLPSKLFIFDELEHEALVFDFDSNEFVSVGRGKEYPGLNECKYIKVGKSVHVASSEESANNSWTVLCSPTESANPIYTRNIYLIDVTGDWKADFVEENR